MQEIYADDQEQDTCLHADVCIIGGGAAGITIARALLDTDVNVMLLESGEHGFRQETQDLYEFENAGYPLRAQKGYVSRNRYYGGSTNTWQGRCGPLDVVDFTVRDWIPDSGWPIQKSDIDPYYARAADVLQLPDAGYFANNAWRKYLIEQPRNFLADGKLEPAIFLLGKKPLNFRLAYAGELRTSGNVQVCLNANVTNIETNGAGCSVERVLVKSLRGARFYVKASRYVLACGGWENARLLLASNTRDSKGVGNQFDNVGRYYAEHPKILGSRIYPEAKVMRSPIMFWKRKLAAKGYVRIGIKLSESIQREYRLPNNYIELMYPQSMRDAIEQSEKLLSGLRFSPSVIHKLIKIAPYVFDLADAFERMLFNLPLRFEHLTMISHMEQIPNRESRVILSDEVDELNVPKIKVKLVVSEKDKTNMKLFHKIIGNEIAANGLGRFVSELPAASESWPGLSDSSHHIGTTRMHRNPEFGVVDADCKVHTVDNLYVAGCSVFPTGGHVNPTLTIVALALRMAEHLKALAK